MKMYPNLFKGLGKIEPEHHIKLKEDISPKVHPPRKILASLREKVKEEMNNMEKTGVIKKLTSQQNGSIQSGLNKLHAR